MRPSFSERMAQGREIAQAQRNRGLPTGKSARGWNYKRPDLTGLDMLEAYLYQWRKDIRYHAIAAIEFELFGHEWEGL